MSSSKGATQIFLQLFFMISISFTFYQAIASVFTGDSPSWRCVTNISSPFCNQYFGVEVKNTDRNFSKRCVVLEREEWEYTRTPAYSYITEFNLVCEDNYKSALVSCSFFVGSFIATFLCGTASDSYGRKKVFTFSFLLVTITSIGQYFTRNVWELMVWRSVLGSGCTAGAIQSALYLAELIPPRSRSLCVNLASLAYPIGGLFITCIAYLERRWRRLQLFISLPSLFIFIACFFVPESPYWFVARKRWVEAEAVIHQLTCMDGTQIKLKRPTVNPVENQRHIDIEKEKTKVVAIRPSGSRSELLIF